MPNKKLRFSFLALLLALVFVFASCSSPAAVSVAIRWKEAESHVYNITLAKKSTDTGYSDIANDIVFVNNILMKGDEAYSDEILPSEVSGTFESTLATSNDTQTFSTQQTLTTTYTKSVLDEQLGENVFAIVKSFVDGLSGAQRSIVVSVTDEKIVLTSEIQTSVTFKKVDDQTPKSSTRTIDGFYLGISHQERNDISVSTEYDGATAKVTKIENGQTVWNAVSYPVSQKAIDVNQILLYQRSLDQTEAFASTPSVNVYNPMTNSTIVVSFGLTIDANVLLKYNGTQTPSIVNCITAATSTSAGSVGLFAFFNNPKDTKMSGVGPLNIFTPVKWQNGFLVFELASYTSEEISQLKYVG